MSIYLDIIGQGDAQVTASAAGTQIYEPFFTEISISTVKLVALTTGNLTVLSGFEVTNDAYIPSGYTNTAFLPSSNDNFPNSDNVYVRTYLNADRTETSFPIFSGPSISTGTKGGLAFKSLNSGQFNRHLQTQKWILYTGNSLNTSAFKPYGQYSINNTGIVVPFNIFAPPFGPVYVFGRLDVFKIDERFDHIERSGVFALLNHEKIGFGTYNPTEKMHVEGNIKIDGGYINPVTGNNVIFNITGILV